MAKQPKPEAVSKLSSDLQPRKAPMQKRAEVTVQHILDTSAALLEEVGLDNFNTNLLAERADIRIATVYRYFPNKLAILSALFSGWFEHFIEKTSFISELSDPSNDWRVTIESFIDCYVAIVSAQKGHLAIRRAVLAAPELTQVEAKLTRKLSGIFVEVLEARGLPYTTQQMQTFTEVFMVTSGQALDFALIKSRKRQECLKEIVAETKLLQLSYLANYLD